MEPAGRASSQRFSSTAARADIQARLEALQEQQTQVRAALQKRQVELGQGLSVQAAELLQGPLAKELQPEPAAQPGVSSDSTAAGIQGSPPPEEVAVEHTAKDVIMVAEDETKEAGLTVEASPHCEETRGFPPAPPPPGDDRISPQISEPSETSPAGGFATQGS
jgi:predicted secreted Zn-dependent protease